MDNRSEGGERRGIMKKRLEGREQRAGGAEERDRKGGRVREETSI